MKTFRILLIWFALYSVQTFAQQHTLEVWMDQTAEFTADGKTVTKLTFYEKDPNTDYLAFNMALRVPDGIKINQVKSGREYVNDIELSVRATGTHTIACNMPEEGVIKIICTSSLNQDLYPDDEDGNIYYPIFTIGLVAESSAYNGTYAIEMSDVWFVKQDEDGNLSANILDHIEYCNFVISGGTDFPGIDYTIPEEQFGTLILPFNSEIPSGMNVYECTGVSEDNTLLLGNVASIAANTPYIVTGNAGLYHFDGEYMALHEHYSTDFMTGVFKVTDVPQDAYVMQNHKNTTGIGFYKVGSTAVKVSPYRCYLNALPAGASIFKLPMGDVTGIGTEVFGSSQIVNVYNLDGKIIRANINKDDALKGLGSGIYIVNDKKYTIE